MKRIIVSIAFIFVNCFLISCKKESTTLFSCSNLTQGIRLDSATLVKNEINKICSQLTDSTTQQKLQKLTETISSKCNINATVLCADCIQTLPTQSEIKVSFSSVGIQFSKVIDIISRDPLEFAGMHD
jgi:hypothetical protein